MGNWMQKWASQQELYGIGESVPTKNQETWMQPLILMSLLEAFGQVTELLEFICPTLAPQGHVGTSSPKSTGSIFENTAFSAAKA